MAVFPTSGDFSTNPEYTGSFIPTLWSGKLLAKFYQNTMLSEIMNTDYEGELKNKGDTIRIRTAPSITINDYTGAGSTLATEVPVPIFQDMQVNKAKYFSVQTNDVLAQQADMDLMNMFTEDAAKQLKIAIEDEVFFNAFVTNGPAAANAGDAAGAISASYNLGTDAAPVVVTNAAAGLLNTILAMSAALDEQNVPEDGRFLVISPFDRQILMQTNIAQAYFTGDSSSIIRTGKIGMLDRFTVYVSNLLPKGAQNKALVSGLAATSSGATNTSAARRTMVAGTKHACSFAMTISKTEPLRNQTDFGDIVRGLAVYGRKVVKNEALIVAKVA